MEDKDIKMPNYKLWHFGKTKHDRVVVEKFYAEDDNAAYKHLAEFSSEIKLPNGKALYYAKIHYTKLVDSKGNGSDPIDIEDERKMYAWYYRRDKSWLRAALSEISSWLHWLVVDKPRDFMYWCKDLVYLLKNKEARSNQWNLDLHLLETIEKNVPSLLKDSHGLMFLDEAVMQLHKDEPGFDLDAYMKEHISDIPREVEELAMKIQREEYSNLLLYVKLYKYYADFGYIDFDDPEQVEFDKKWRCTLPIKEGTYDEISDYKQAEAMSRAYWAKIWDWVKQHGQKLYD